MQGGTEGASSYISEPECVGSETSHCPGKIVSLRRGCRNIRSIGLKLLYASASTMIRPSTFFFGVDFSKWSPVIRASWQDSLEGKKKKKKTDKNLHKLTSSSCMAWAWASSLT